MLKNKEFADKQTKYHYIFKLIGFSISTAIKRKLRDYLPFLQPSFPTSPQCFSEEKIIEFLPKANQIRKVIVEPIFIHEYEADKSKNIMGISIEYPTETLKAVVKFNKPLEPKLSKFINNANLGYCRELLFYEQLSHLLPISTPQYINGHVDKTTGNYFLILKRIENAHIFADHENCPVEESCFALSHIAKVHALPLKQLGSLHWIVSNSNDRAFRWIAMFFKKHFESSYIQLIHKLCDYINVLPSSFVHVDFRPGNMFFKYDDHNKIQDMILFDWVAPTISTGIYDVVYFMIMGMDPKIMRENYDKLANAYLNSLAKSGVVYNKEKFDTDFQVVSLLLIIMSYGFKKIELFADWNVAQTQWLDWEHKMKDFAENFDYELLSEQLTMDKQTLKKTLQSLVL